MSYGITEAANQNDNGLRSLLLRNSCNNRSFNIIHNDSKYIYFYR